MKAEATAAGRELRILHHICSVYALIGLAVPTLGMATASRMHVLDSLWLIASSGLTAVAAVTLFATLALRTKALEESSLASPGRLAGTAGAFNLLWTS
ncbi:hypothetical protein ACFWN5_19665 [Streptomyces sp. NPDC058430]|uniref:hypothetical protein n=1 Tax=Streptomyces sp. NPDC058430 TaxID=3346495 RepID=UPI003646AB1A